ncbi:MAG: hypothetical protein ABL952_17740, partial [Pyrinomonadaceae bacterium]
MKDRKDTGDDSPKTQFTALYSGVTVIFSVVALVATYFLANSEYDITVKARGFSVIVAAFLVSAASLYLWISRGDKDTDGVDLDTRTDRQLQALDDANTYFAGSLRPSDSFRLVASRVREILPYRTVTLHLYDEMRRGFCATESDGPDSGHRSGRFFALNDGPVSRSYFSQSVEVDHATTSARPVVAVPLRNGTD